MTPHAQVARRKRELAAIHAGRKALGWSEDEYRDTLEDWTGKRSAGELSSELRRLVIENMRKAGFARSAREAHPQVRLIQRLWGELHRLGAVRVDTGWALNRYVERMTKVSHVNFLTPAQRNRVVESMKKWKARVEAELREEQERGEQETRNP